MIPNDIEILINKYLDNEIGEQERLEVEKLLSNNEQYNTYYKDVKQLREMWRQMLKHPNSENIEHDIQRFKSNIQKLKTKKITQKIIYFGVSLAACVTLFFIFKPFVPSLLSPKTNTIGSWSANKQQNLNLPDQSKISLNYGTCIKYDSANFLNNREIIHQYGISYYTIEAMKKKTFKFKIGNQYQGQVLGTKFSIKTYPLQDTSKIDSVLIYVDEGTVEVKKINDEHYVRVGKGEQVKLISNHAPILLHQRDTNYLAWKTKKISFNNTPLSEVARVLEEVYHKKIRILGHSQKITMDYFAWSFEAICKDIDLNTNLIFDSSTNTFNDEK